MQPRADESRSEGHRSETLVNRWKAALKHIRDHLRRPAISHPETTQENQLHVLTTHLPAAIIARLLGIHIKVAVEWQHAAAGDWTTYAAHYSRRHRPVDQADHPVRDGQAFGQLK